MGSDKARVLTLADNAASLLQVHKDELIERWGGRIQKILAEKDLKGIVSDTALQEDMEGLVQRLLERLHGVEPHDEFATFYHWIYDGQQYEVRLTDLIQVMLNLKDAAAETIHDACPDAVTAFRMEGVTSQTIDHMVRRCAELYQATQESDLRSIQERLQQIFSAWEVDEALARVESPDQAFRVACEKLGDIFPLVGCIVRLFQNGTEEIEFCSKRNLPVPLVTEKAQYLTQNERHVGGALDILELCRRKSEPVVRQVAQSAAPNVNQRLLFGPPVTDQVFNAVELWSAGVRSLACLPVSVSGRIIGTFLLLSSAANTFDETELRLLRDFAEVLGAAFARTARLEESRRQMTEAEVIASIGRSLLELPTMEALLQAVVGALQQYRDYPHVSLFRVDWDADRCVLMAAAGPQRDRWPDDYAPAIGEGQVGHCAREGKPILSSGWPRQRRRVVPTPETTQIEAELSLPITKGEYVIGVLHLCSRAPSAFAETELDALRLLSTHIAIALQNIQLLEEQRRNRTELERVHRQLATIIRSTAVGITTLDTDGVYTHWSPSCEKLLGYTAQEVVGKMQPTDLPPTPYDLRATLSQCAREGQVSRESTMLTKEGTPRIIQQIVVPMVEESGEQTGFTCCLVDVTDKRESEEALRQERNKLNLVVDAMGAGLALFDQGRLLQWANSTLMNWFRIDPGTFGQDCGAVFRCGHEHTDDCPMAQADETGEPQSGMLERTDQDGTWHCYLQVATPVQRGRQKQILVLMLDITEQRLQTEQVMMTDRLARALERTLDLERVLHLFLTCVTAGHALGFNRAFTFLLDETGKKLIGNQAVGPASAEDAQRIWSQISSESQTLEQLLAVTQQADGDRLLTDTVRQSELSMEAPQCVLVESLADHRTIIVKNAQGDPRVNEQLKDRLGLGEFVVVPLIARDEPLGVVLADNKYSGAPIESQQAELLRMFSAQASLAIANARAYRKIRDQYEQLRETQDELIKAERLAGIGRMASHLAHEVRNPLTTIGGFARALERAAQDAGTRHNAGVIYKEVIRLERALDNLLELARPIRPNIAATDLNALVRETADQFSFEVQDKEAELRLDLEDDLPPVNVDPSLIKQVLINFVRNALEAVETMERRVILLGTALSPRGVLLSVSDTGCGMDERTKEEIFAPFFTTKKKGGTGLGLAISHRILMEHGARLEIDTALGKGSTFVVTFPLREDARPQAGDTKQDKSAPARPKRSRRNRKG